MQQHWQKKIFPGEVVWRQALPGLVVLTLIVGARLLGLFQGLELKMLDTLLRWRPAEATDERILIVGVTEDDIQRLGTYPVPDGVLANLIRALEAHQPRAIGIDIYRDLPVEPGHQTLVETLTTRPQVIAIEYILNHPPIAAPAYLPDQQVGFVDFPVDADGFVRRALLGFRNTDGAYRFSLALKLAEIYLQSEGLTLENGLQDPAAMRFGTTEFSRVPPNTGGYIKADTGGHQILLNVRGGATPFRRVSLTEVLDNQVNPDWIQDAMVLVGITASSARDVLNSAAVRSGGPQVYGVEMHAHVTSQLVSTVMDNRAPLRTWPDGVEYLWIVLWGGLGIVLIRRIKSPSRYLLVIGLVGLGIAAVSYGWLVLGGWWIPLVPALLAFTVNGLVISGFYLYDQMLRSRIEERQRVIEQTYNAIHNGPLQTLALLLRDSGETLSWPEALPKLNQMDHDLRHIYEGLLNSLHLSLAEPKLAAGSDAADLFHETLYEIYTETLQRDFPGFKSLGPKVVSFEPLNTKGLSPDDHQAIGRFLEEALCNVGKHAINPTRLTVTCMVTEEENRIQVKDNGQGRPEDTPHSNLGRRGTRQAEQLAQRLGGHFQRRSTPSGTCCELRWPVQSPSQKGFKWFS
jgi:CHASE2 domain-containing sensor protein